MNFTKITIVSCFCFLISMTCFGQQSGEIIYQETIQLKIELDNAPSGVDISGMIPTSRSVSKKLIFDKDESVYKNGEETVEDTEINSDDGSFQIVIMESEIESKFYINYKEKECLDQQGFMGKAFIIEKPVNNTKWKITSEKVMYLDYECMKATMTDDEGEDIVAWFAPAIPVKAGPSGYGQLPGAILMLSKGDNDLEIKATKVELKEVDKIKKPTDGQIVTDAEYQKIVDDKIKEMKKEYHGNSISVRG